MASTSSSRRVNSRTAGYDRNTYIVGNTVRSAQTAPRRQERSRNTSTPQLSHSARRNRLKALQMSRGYVLFLAIICAATLFVCVQYLQLKAEITTQANAVASMETKFSQLKADNDAYYSETLASVDVEKIRKKAISQLGMNYATKDQIMTYHTNGSSYVRQYQDVPDAK